MNFEENNEIVKNENILFIHIVIVLNYSRQPELRVLFN